MPEDGEATSATTAKAGLAGKASQLPASWPIKSLLTNDVGQAKVCMYKGSANRRPCQYWCMWHNLSIRVCMIVCVYIYLDDIFIPNKDQSRRLLYRGKKERMIVQGELTVAPCSRLYVLSILHSPGNRGEISNFWLYFPLYSFTHSTPEEALRSVDVGVMHTPDNI